MSRTSETIDMTVGEKTGVRERSDQASAFRDLADRHLEAAYHLAHAILRDPVEAQDATHDAFIQAWRSWESLRDANRFDAWFDRILVNTCRNRLRAAARRRTIDISNEIALIAVDAFSPALERELIGAALATLSPDHQLVVALRFYRDLTVDEIAIRIGIPAGTVASRLHYAIKRLQAAIDAAEDGETAR